MTRPHVIKSRPRGFARTWARAVAFAAAALLPVTLMGVTVPSAVAVREAKLAKDDCQRRLDERNHLVTKLSGYGKRGVIDEVEALERVVRDLVPSDLDRLEVFGRLRAVATPRGTEITTIRLIRTHHVQSHSVEDGEDSENTAIVVDEVLVSMADSIGDAFALVDDMRATGLPTLVLGFDFTRESVHSNDYQTEMRLGFLRRVRLDPNLGAASDEQ